MAAGSAAGGQAHFPVAFQGRGGQGNDWRGLTAVRPFEGANFPLDPGYLPASVVVKLAPFSPETLQHFVFLERPRGSTEQDGEGFVSERNYVRGSDIARLTPMGINYDTVGDFYVALSDGLRALVAR
jgi:hypothetical protein